MLKIIGVTGSRDLPESHAAIVAAAVRSADTIMVGDADGADCFARRAAKPNQELVVFVTSNDAKLPRPAALAQRSMDMVKAIPQIRADAVIVGFPTSPCPGEIKRPLKSWQSCGSGTWSTLAMAAGRGIRVVVYRFGEMFLPVWPSCTWVKSTEFPGAWELEIQQTSLF